MQLFVGFVVDDASSPWNQADAMSIAQNLVIMLFYAFSMYDLLIFPFCL